MAVALLRLLSVQLLLLCRPSGILSATFTFYNNCEYTVWPGILSSAGTNPLSTTGFSLSKSESKTISTPSNWSGRLWGRTLCTTDSTGKFTCVTGDCGSGKLECSGSGAAPPTTLAEFTLSGSGGMDFYDVSLVDGYNLPMLVVPEGGGSSANCTSTGCLVDINGMCPTELRVAAAAGEGVACKSACDAFGKEEYCCSGAYGNPHTCKATAYSEVFKKACPRAYSYAYDDGTSTFTCAQGANYQITFCPPTSSQKSAGDNPQAPPLINGTMVYLGGDLFSRAATSATLSHAISLLSLAMSWQLLHSLF